MAEAPREQKERYIADSIFWVEVDRIKPNPFQPRRSFDEAALKSLSDSIRQYGVLQPLTVTKREIERPGEGIFVEYELIAGERRLRAAKLAGVTQVPVVIRYPEGTEQDDQLKLELAIIENLQREDLNAVDRAKAFKQLVDEFHMTHLQVGEKVGRSREYVSNTLRILMLPEEMLQALVDGRISDGHTRPLLMLIDRPQEQQTLFKEITERKMTVRESERVARRIAIDKTRKEILPPEMMAFEKELAERLGTRVRIEKKEQGGKVLIDFFSPEDLEHIRALFEQHAAAMQAAPATAPAAPVAASAPAQANDAPAAPDAVAEEATESIEDNPTADEEMNDPDWLEPKPEEEDEDLYSVRNFSL
ncbi:MAG TPA: ParB/RepB/Spo0J family partition protein [Candidatus Paceibacterota bacterium]|nr:ParB/RepB/Spo0J family partition protein [Candidatus Paceibacterota bacterium]